MKHTSETTRALENSERKPAPGASKIGGADLQETLSVSIRVRHRSGAPASMNLEQLAATPSHKLKHISRDEYTANFGAAQADLDQVATFARTHGLTVIESSIPRRTVVLSGTVAQINQAFA